MSASIPVSNLNIFKSKTKHNNTYYASDVIARLNNFHNYPKTDIKVEPGWGSQMFWLSASQCKVL